MKNTFSYLLIVFATLTTPFVSAQEQDMKVAVIDWTQIETLLALGIQPIGAAQVADYNAWVKSPTIPAITADLGLRTQPNLERLSELKPERIFISPMFQSLAPQLSRIAPVTSIALYKKDNVSWQALKTYTRTIAKDTNKEDAAEALIQSAQNKLAELTTQVPANAAPLLMVQFMDARHVRVFGNNSMYKIAANQIGLKNAWQGDTNSWGFSLVGIDKLLGIKGQIVVIEPLPAGVMTNLQQDAFWQYLVTQTGHPMLTIAPVWSFGAIPSTVRFATLLTAALNKEAK
ncbi:MULTISPECIES: ABC transporter substrate-binding protein [Marinomonas]|uniref:ABC transporter substrate-binding protein n=1 Tax=Marinomonas arctica TaxID=383750 RepID=A0A7H1J6R4_9GAMM|nr:MULTISPECIES: ABC transporter substrate-binding protein [Marinomonas]MCS7485154.1 ABC transporter substrate-binding protein [Marinomonas sp. BSi20414]QNT06180.1 ABC transporter substrate-binding protein [Marinomonas arctica]GGN18191.1 ABC transporter substrate-binding protein [Marinomonas arctica]